MKARRISLFLLSAALTAAVCMIFLRPAIRNTQDAPNPVQLHQPLVETPRSAEALSPDDEPLAAEAPVVSAGKTPVQPLEERDDAMLFESEALFGTPFSQAVVMPFD